METKTNSVSVTAQPKKENEGDDVEVLPSQKLFVDKKAMTLSINMVRFAVFAGSVNTTVEQPNYPIMVLSGAHPDSFETTGGLGFSAATYFVPMTALLGVAVSSIIIGSLSDKLGRKPCLLVCLYGSVVTSVLKYILRRSFWLFNIANFANGLLNGYASVAMAYVSDVHTGRRKIEFEIGLIVGLSVLGSSGGGVIAILMETQGLFAPILVAAALTLISALLSTKFLIESLGISKLNEPISMEEGCEEKACFEQSQKIPSKTLSIIVAGALLDNFGSSGLMPLSLAPLAFNTFYTDFVDQGLTPIMSQVAYKWISVLVATLVVPGAIMSPKIFNKIGPAGGCILGNVITGLVTIFLLLIASAPATNGTFALFLTFFYLCFPFTVISQLSAGPMLDFIAPPDKKGMLQGINNTVRNIGFAVSPVILGALADVAGTPTAIWTCVGISFSAALVNTPLMFIKGLGMPTKQTPIPADLKPLLVDNEALVQKIINGEWVSAETLININTEREMSGKSFVILHAGTYKKDKANLTKLRQEAIDDYKFYRSLFAKQLKAVHTEDPKIVAERINKSLTYSSNAQHSEVMKVNKEIGEWFVDYLNDAGYAPFTFTQVIKQMILSAFPVIRLEDTVNADNIEQSILNFYRVFNNYLEIEEMEPDVNFTTFGTLAAGQPSLNRGTSV